MAPKILDEELHENHRKQIKGIARAQMADHGVDSISMRGIARTLGMTAPALYRYYANRDALIIDLIVDAYYVLADLLTDTLADLPPAAHAARLSALIDAYRTWALANPTDLLLLVTNGNSVPGRSVPPEEAFPATREVFVVWARAVRAALIEPLPEDDTLPPAMHEQLAWVRANSDYGPMPLYALYVATALWAHMTGLLVMELFNQFQPVIGDSYTFFHLEIRQLCQTLGAALPDTS